MGVFFSTHTVLVRWAIVGLAVFGVLTWFHVSVHLAGIIAVWCAAY
jgi:hypothetical protein